MSELTRRRLLALLGSGALGYGLDVDRLLWVPGAKTWFLPTGPVPVSFEMTWGWDELSSGSWVFDDRAVRLAVQKMANLIDSEALRLMRALPSERERVTAIHLAGAERGGC